MKYLPLRTTLTLLCIAVAFVPFGILAGIDAGFIHTLAATRLDRIARRLRPVCIRL